jgi:hypothetical protein
VAEARALEIYEDHIRRLPRAERLRLLALLADDLADEETEGVTDEAAAEDIMAFHGLGKELWEGMDAQEYVNALREGRPLPGEPPESTGR